MQSPPPLSTPPDASPVFVALQKDMDTVMDIVGEDYRLSLSGYLFVMRKDMFRDHLFKCKGYAEPDVSEEEVMTTGQCGCLDLNLDEVSWLRGWFDVFFFLFGRGGSWVVLGWFGGLVSFFCLLGTHATNNTDRGAPPFCSVLRLFLGFGSLCASFQSPFLRKVMPQPKE